MNKQIKRIGVSCLLLLLLSMGQTIAQLSISVTNTEIRNVLRQIEKTSDYTFFYSDNFLDLSQKVTIQAQDETIENILNTLFRNTNIAWRINNTQIALSVKQVQQDKLSANTIQQQVTRTISGKIFDENQEPVLGATVVIKGNPSHGTVSDMNGEFVLTNVPENAVLQITYVGLETHEVAVNGRTTISVIMKSDTELLEDLVVTALGIKRTEKALGYAVQKVDGDKLATVKTVDMATTLTGQVAGLNIKNRTDFNQAPEITLRGESNPLLVVDGVPYYNITLRDIASDDIESIDVLKGATASALYGARGDKGAIMITTKRAKEEGLQVTVNSNTMFDAGYIKFPEVQTAYSSGGGGHYGTGDYVWGDKLDIGRTATMYNPVTYEWEEMPLVSKGKNNLRNFQQLSFITNNNVSVSQKGQYGSIRTSLTHVYNKGQFPNQKLNKFTYTVAGDMKYKKFSFDGALTYNKRFFPNDFGAGYGGGGYLYNLVVWTGTEIDIRDYKNYWAKENEVQNWMDKNWYDNPYYIANEIIRNQHYDLTNGHLNTSYDITPWLKASLRSGLDVYSQKEEWKNPIGSSGGWSKKGYYAFRRTSGYSLNNDVMLMADKTIEDFSINGLFGGSVYYYEYDLITAETQNGITIPGFYSLNASVDPVKTSKNYYRKQMNSLYGKLSLGWRSTLFLDVTARNDWASTLEKNARSYFYPSISGSVIMSEFIPMPEFIGFWKLRGSWTQTKQDLSIYETNATYNIETNVWEGLNSSAYPTIIRGALVLPSASRSWEIGTAFSFLDNRLRLDATYYNKLYYNLIRQASVSPTSGFLGTLINIDEEQIRKGMEITLSADAVKTKDFNWNTIFNWSLDRYYYHKIDDTYSTQKPWVNVGKRWDWMAANDYVRDPQGNIVHINGYPEVSRYDALQGYTEPDWMFGWANSFRYKNFSLDFSIDGRVGGVLFSTMDQALWNSGAHIDSDTQWRYDEVVDGKITFVGKGVKVVSGSVDYDAYGNITRDDRVFAPNDDVVSYEAYMKFMNPYIGTRRTQNIFDQTYFKLRNLAINYNCPKHMAEKIGMKGMSVGLIGQNLLVWTKELRFVDPDRSSDNLNAPSVRYMGINLKLDF